MRNDSPTVVTTQPELDTLAAAASAHAGPARLISPEEESKAFARLRMRQTGAHIRELLATSRLRMILVCVLSVLFWLGLFALFFEGFTFLGAYIGVTEQLYAETVHFVFGAFFLSLMVMLAFSSAIILYGGLFRSHETEFLLTLPLRTERIVLFKFQEAIVFSSWGFILLSSPMLIAYGLATGAPWYYYLLFLPFLLSFAYIPSSLGAICCLLIVYWLPKVRTLAVVAVAAAAIGLAFYNIWAVLQTEGRDLLTEGWFRETLGRLEFSRNRLSPSWWLSTGLLEAARPGTGEPGDYPAAQSVLFLVLLISNAMFGHVLVVWAGSRLFRAAHSGIDDDRAVRGESLRRISRRLFGHTVSRWLWGSSEPAREGRKGRAAWIDRAAMILSAPLAYPVRLLIVKDLRVFRRDPIQWSQFLIFFGLLALYFINIRRFRYEDPYTGWINMISFLNLAVVGLILSTFTTRFIFPMISLEGSRFWILGLLPIKRDTIIWGKFLFAAGGSIIPCTTLILMSDLMLGIAPLIVVVHQFTCIVLCVGLSGIAVGLGARLPDLREQSPSKIAAGFGGTLNLVLSALYIILVVLLTALPCHFYVAAKANAVGTQFSFERIEFWVYAGAASAIALGIAATAIPLRSGLKAFRAMEF